MWIHGGADLEAVERLDGFLVGGLGRLACIGGSVAAEEGAGWGSGEGDGVVGWWLC